MKSDLPPWFAYLTPAGWLVLWIQYKRSETRPHIVILHLRQMMGLMILFVLIWLLQAVYVYSTRVNYITIPAYFLLFFLWLWGLSDALNKKDKPIPMVGKIIQQTCLFLR